MLYFAILSANFAQFKDSTTPEHQIILLSITITSATEVTFSPMLVCQQDYRRTTKRISTKPGRKLGIGPE